MRTDNRSARGQGPVRGRRARRVSRGQALVEFAMVVPLFFLMMFGFIEIALITASIASFNFAAKDAARLGSLLGPTDNTVDSQIVNLIRGRVSGVVVAKLVQVEIYLSDAGGDPPATTSPVEDVYDANGNVIGTLTWPASMRNDTLLDADYLGVRITYQYTYLTSYLSGGTSTLTLTANSVQRIEPQDFQSHIVVPPVLSAWLTKASPARSSGSGSSHDVTPGSGSGLVGAADAPVADVRRQAQIPWQTQTQTQTQTRAWGGAA